MAIAPSVVILVAWLAVTRASLWPTKMIVKTTTTIDTTTPASTTWTIPTETETTTPAVTSTTPSDSGSFVIDDIDFDRIAKEKSWFLKSLSVSEDPTEPCNSAAFSITPNGLKISFFKDGNPASDLECTKDSLGMLQCAGEHGSVASVDLPILPLGTNYETYLVVGYRAHFDGKGVPRADLWCAFYTQRGPGPGDREQIAALLRTVRSKDGGGVVMYRVGVSCKTHSSTEVPPVTFVPVHVNCLKKNFILEFDLAKYTGSWHDVMVSKMLMPPGNVCLTHVFSAASNTVSYFEKTYDIRASQYTTFQGQARVEGPASHGVLDITRPSGVSETYRVVDTDYDSYSVVVSCDLNGGNNASQGLRVMSRRYWLPSVARAKVDDVLRLLGVDDANQGVMGELDTRDCLPDSCPPRGPAMQNFDVRQFTGTWYLVKWLDDPAGSTPLCVTYLHAAAVNGSLFLEANDARDSFSRAGMLEALPVDLLSGEARYVIQDHPGAPVRHFDVLYASQPSSWALVSLCSDPADDNRDGTVHNSLRIITRNRNPSTLPEKEVSDVLKQFDLDLIKFETVQESMDICGTIKCPVDISVVELFDRSKFQGLWVVLEETPSDVTTGFCTRHYFRKGVQNKMTLDVYQFNSDGESVANRTYDLDTVDPTAARFTSDDALHRGRDIFENYWVLDTDYKEFAVVYSCSDRAMGWNNARTWVLGRSTVGLSHAATRRVLDVLTNSYVDMRRLKDVDHHIAPCPPTTDHYCPDDPSGPPPPRGPPSGGGRLVAQSGLLALGVAAIAFVGIHARVGLRRVGLAMSSESTRVDPSCTESTDSQCSQSTDTPCTDSPFDDSLGTTTSCPGLPDSLRTGISEVLDRLG